MNEFYPFLAGFLLCLILCAIAFVWWLIHPAHSRKHFLGTLKGLSMVHHGLFVRLDDHQIVRVPFVRFSQAFEAEDWCGIDPRYPPID